MTIIAKGRLNGEWVIIRVDKGGAGGLMAPPGAAILMHEMIAYRSERHLESGEWSFYGSIENAVDPANNDWVPSVVFNAAAKLLAEQQLVMSPLWLDHVYGYWKGMYAPEPPPGQPLDRTAANLVHAGPPERHGGFLCVKKWFPEAVPDIDRIESGGRYGAGPCVKCDKRVQYEAAVDGFSAFSDRFNTACPRGGQHEWVAMAERHVNYPHEPGRLYDCPACESRCHCNPDPGTTECVFKGPHRYQKEHT